MTIPKTGPKGLTTRTIEGNDLVAAAVAAGKQVEVRDGGPGSVTGLILRVTPAGTRTWSCQYVRKGDGAKRRVTIGTFPEFSLKQAREAARAIRDAVARGEDPSAKPEPVVAYTFDMLADAWMRHAERIKTPAGVYNNRILLAKDVRPAIGGKAADAVRKVDIGRIIDAVVDRGSPVSANRVLALVKAIYAWGIKKDLVTSNPTVGIDKPSEERPRDRVLSAAEVAAFWHALGGAPVSPGTALAMRLSLVTGQRIGQVTAMTKAELDLAASNPMWTVRGAGTKNGELVRVPLSPLAVRLIHEALSLSGGSAYVFPTPGAGTGIVPDEHVASHAASRAMTRARLVKGATGSGWPGFGIEHFTVHDLRRTAASHMAAMGISPGTIAHVLDHISVTKASVTAAVYIKYSFDREKRSALEAWATRLEAIIAGHADTVANNVVALRA